jgi:ParB family chromosome partitioning protein
MSKTKTGLGRGLDALLNPQVKKEITKEIPIENNDVKEDDGKSFNVIAKILTSKIRPNPFQPRTDFDKESLDELKKSILENGLIQPVTVRRAENGFYELISGERRLRAFNEIGYREIPAYIIKVDSKEAMLALSLIENIQRKKLNPIEVAQAYKRLIMECDLSQEDVAEKVGKDRTTIANSIRLLKLPEEIQQSLIRDEISVGHARALINLDSYDQKIEILKEIISKGLTVRKVESIVKKLNKSNAPAKKRKTEQSKDIDSIHIAALEDKLRRIFGTKVICKQKNNGTGSIVIEFYSNDELERLIELVESIEG